MSSEKCFKFTILTPWVLLDRELPEDACRDNLADQFAETLCMRTQQELKQYAFWPRNRGEAYLSTAFRHFEERYINNSDYTVIVLSRKYISCLDLIYPRLLVYCTVRNAWAARFVLVLLGEPEQPFRFDTQLFTHRPIIFYGKATNYWSTDVEAWTELLGLPQQYVTQKVGEDRGINDTFEYHDNRWKSVTDLRGRPFAVKITEHANKTSSWNDLFMRRYDLVSTNHESVESTSNRSHRIYESPLVQSKNRDYCSYAQHHPLLESVRRENKYGGRSVSLSPIQRNCFTPPVAHPILSKSATRLNSEWSPYIRRRLQSEHLSDDPLRIEEKEEDAFGILSSASTETDSDRDDMCLPNADLFCLQSRQEVSMLPSKKRLSGSRDRRPKSYKDRKRTKSCTKESSSADETARKYNWGKGKFRRIKERASELLHIHPKQDKLVRKSRESLANTLRSLVNVSTEIMAVQPSETYKDSEVHIHPVKFTTSEQLITQPVSVYVGDSVRYHIPGVSTPVLTSGKTLNAPTGEVTVAAAHISQNISSADTANPLHVTTPFGLDSQTQDRGFERPKRPRDSGVNGASIGLLNAGSDVDRLNSEVLAMNASTTVLSPHNFGTEKLLKDGMHTSEAAPKPELGLLTVSNEEPEKGRYENNVRKATMFDQINVEKEPLHQHLYFSPLTEMQSPSCPTSDSHFPNDIPEKFKDDLVIAAQNTSGQELLAKNVYPSPELHLVNEHVVDATKSFAHGETYTTREDSQTDRHMSDKVSRVTCETNSNEPTLAKETDAPSPYISMPHFQSTFDEQKQHNNATVSLEQRHFQSRANEGQYFPTLLDTADNEESVISYPEADFHQTDVLEHIQPIWQIGTHVHTTFLDAVGNVDPAAALVSRQSAEETGMTEGPHDQLVDVSITPELFLPYVVEKENEKSDLLHTAIPNQWDIKLVEPRESDVGTNDKKFPQGVNSVHVDKNKAQSSTNSIQHELPQAEMITIASDPRRLLYSKPPVKSHDEGMNTIGDLDSFKSGSYVSPKEVPLSKLPVDGKADSTDAVYSNILNDPSLLTNTSESSLHSSSLVKLSEDSRTPVGDAVDEVTDGRYTKVTALGSQEFSYVPADGGKNNLENQIPDESENDNRMNKSLITESSSTLVSDMQNTQHTNDANQNNELHPNIICETNKARTANHFGRPHEESSVHSASGTMTTLVSRMNVEQPSVLNETHIDSHLTKISGDASNNSNSKNAFPGTSDTYHPIVDDKPGEKSSLVYNDSSVLESDAEVQGEKIKFMGQVSDAEPDVVKAQTSNLLHRSTPDLATNEGQTVDNQVQLEIASTDLLQKNINEERRDQQSERFGDLTTEFVIPLSQNKSFFPVAPVQSMKCDLDKSDDVSVPQNSKMLSAHPPENDSTMPDVEAICSDSIKPTESDMDAIRNNKSDLENYAHKPLFIVTGVRERFCRSPGTSVHSASSVSTFLDSGIVTGNHTYSDVTELSLEPNLEVGQYNSNLKDMLEFSPNNMECLSIQSDETLGLTIQISTMNETDNVESDTSQWSTPDESREISTIIYGDTRTPRYTEEKQEGNHPVVDMDESAESLENTCSDVYQHRSAYQTAMDVSEFADDNLQKESKKTEVLQVMGHEEGNCRQIEDDHKLISSTPTNVVSSFLREDLVSRMASGVDTALEFSKTVDGVASQIKDMVSREDSAVAPDEEDLREFIELDRGVKSQQYSIPATVEVDSIQKTHTRYYDQSLGNVPGHSDDVECTYTQSDRTLSPLIESPPTSVTDIAKTEAYQRSRGQELHDTPLELYSISSLINHGDERTGVSKTDDLDHCEQDVKVEITSNTQRAIASKPAEDTRLLLENRVKQQSDESILQKQNGPHWSPNQHLELLETTDQTSIEFVGVSPQVSSVSRKAPPEYNINHGNAGNENEELNSELTVTRPSPFEASFMGECDTENEQVSNLAVVSEYDAQSQHSGYPSWSTWFRNQLSSFVTPKQINQGSFSDRVHASSQLPTNLTHPFSHFDTSHLAPDEIGEGHITTIIVTATQNSRVLDTQLISRLEAQDDIPRDPSLSNNKSEILTDHPPMAAPTELDEEEIRPTKSSKLGAYGNLSSDDVLKPLKPAVENSPSTVENDSNANLNELLNTKLLSNTLTIHPESTPQMDVSNEVQRMAIHTNDLPLTPAMIPLGRGSLQLQTQRMPLWTLSSILSFVHFVTLYIPRHLYWFYVATFESRDQMFVAMADHDVRVATTWYRLQSGLRNPVYVATILIGLTAASPHLRQWPLLLAYFGQTAEVHLFTPPFWVDRPVLSYLSQFVQLIRPRASWFGSAIITSFSTRPWSLANPVD